MGKRVYGAFTLLVVVNGQDVRIQCSLCGELKRSTVDRAEIAEARINAHIAAHIRFISDRDQAYNPVRPPQPDGGDT